MKLPLDGREAPFREKYIRDETPLLQDWIIFGAIAGEPSPRRHDVCDCNGNNVFTGLTLDQALAIVAARDAFLSRVIEVLNES